MLKISTKGQYALLIMTELAEQQQGKFIPLKTLSHRHNLSVKYLEQILIQLSKAGLVDALRGNNGGYRLSRMPDKYTAGEILRALEGELCLCGTKAEGFVTNTGNLEFWNDFEKAINDYVDSVTLDDLVQRNQKQGNLMYFI